MNRLLSVCVALAALVLAHPGLAGPGQAAGDGFGAPALALVTPADPTPTAIGAWRSRPGTARARPAALPSLTGTLGAHCLSHAAALRFKPAPAVQGGRCGDARTASIPQPAATATAPVAGVPAVPSSQQPPVTKSGTFWQFDVETDDGPWGVIPIVAILMRWK